MPLGRTDNSATSNRNENHCSPFIDYDSYLCLVIRCSLVDRRLKVNVTPSAVGMMENHVMSVKSLFSTRFKAENLNFPIIYSVALAAKLLIW